MCGIAGLVRWGDRRDLQQEIRQMSESVVHRGPDGEGVYIRDGVALGHRRLAIIDLESGSQPMANEDESIWITFNGEIYNYRELRAELTGLGHHFKTASDTEVIVHAYEQWGDDCVSHLRGMFAFGVCDFRERRVLLARDHFGIKPLVYRIGEDYVAFASELTALQRINEAPSRGRLQSIEYFFRFGYIPHPDTIYKDVFKLPPGNTLVVGMDGRLGSPREYWQLEFVASDEDEEDWDARLKETLRESVATHLVSDVPFGVFLSGGVDSTLVAMEMSGLLQQKVTAFTIGFEEDSHNELEFARKAADRLGIDLKYEIVRQDAARLLPILVEQYGEPFADSSALPTWHLSQMARHHVPMVLSGDGGDEAFAGYDRYQIFQHHRQLGWLLNRVVRRQGDWPLIIRLLGTRGLSGFSRDTDAWLALMNYIPQRGRRIIWRPEFRHVLETPNPTFEAAAGEDGRDLVTRGQSIDYRTYLPGDILTKVDIASMAHGLEVRTPLIDREVAKLVSRLPLQQRVRQGAGKYLPRKVLKLRFPEAFVDRKKMGFSIPCDQWLKRTQPIRKMLDQRLADPECPLNRWIDPKSVRRLLSLHDLTGRFSTPIWPLLILTLWLEQHPGLTFE